MHERSPNPLSALIALAKRTLVRVQAPIFALVALSTLGAAWAQTCNLAFGGGDGSVATPFLITSEADLEALRDAAVNGGANVGCMTASYSQTQNITLTSTWTRGIGQNQDDNATPSQLDLPFSGSYDGGGFTIAGLDVSVTGFDAAGLFARTDGATIGNLTLVDPQITTTKRRSGSLIGRATNTTVSDVTVTGGSVTGSSISSGAGGLIGSGISVTITDVTLGSAADRTVVTASSYNVAGLIGYAQDLALTNLTAFVDVSGTDSIGGIAGNALWARVENAVVDGIVSGTSYGIGGFFGYFDDSPPNTPIVVTPNVLDSSFTGTVTAGTEQVGGLVGYSYWGTVNAFFTNVTVDATVSVDTANSGHAVGGAVGYLNLYDAAAHATIDGVTVAGSVSGNYWVGGVVGRIEGDGAPRVTITNTASHADVSASNRAGGLIGSAIGRITIDLVTVGPAEGSTTPPTIAMRAGAPGNGNDFGGLAGELTNTGGFAAITNTDVHANVTGKIRLGGLIGKADFNAVNATSDSSIDGVTFAGSVTTTANYSKAGGLIGQLVVRYRPATIKNASNAAPVTGIVQIGGIVGYTEVRGVALTLENVTNTGDVTGSPSANNSTQAGGLVGYADTMSDAVEGSYLLTNVTVTGTITGPGDAVGGLFGFFDEALTLNGATVTATISGDEEIGGLIGDLYSFASITDATVTGTLTGTGRLGGLVGRVDEHVVVTNATVNVDVTRPAGGGYSVGGLFGEVDEGATITGVTVGSEEAPVTISAPDADDVGGAIGYIYNEYRSVSITDATVYASVTASSTAGGLIGKAEVNADSANSPTVISDVLAAGPVTTTSPNVGDVGGLIGVLIVEYQNATISATRSAGGVTAQNDNAGGLIGSAEIQDDGGNVTLTLDDVASTDDVRNSTRRVGGLIGYHNSISGGALVIRNASHEGTVRGTDAVGGLLGYGDDYVTIEDAVTRSTVIGEDDLGGLVGYAYENTIIRRAVAHGSVTGDSLASGLGDIGGLIGEANYSVLIEDSSAHGDVTALSATYAVGGLIGDVEDDGGVVRRSYATGAVSAPLASGVGGLIGTAYDGWTVETSYATGSVAGGTQVGGLIGELSISFSGNVKTSFASGDVSGEEAVGGLIGDFAGGFVGDVYAVGAVSALGSGVNDAFGGLIGRISGTNVRATVRNSFAAGAVSTAAGSTNVGGVVGGIGGTWTVDPDLNFWDVDATGVAVTAGDRGTGLGTDALRSFATFADAGWSIVPVAAPEEFSDSEVDGYLIWVLCDDPNPAGGYPRLAWEEERASCAPDLVVDAAVLTPLVLQGEPFDLVLSFEDADGNPIAAPESTDVTLSAVGGAPDGVLRRVGYPFTAPTVRILAGQTELTVQDLLFTGVSLVANDVTLTVESDDGAFAPATVSFTVTRPVLSVTAEPDELVADGVGLATIRVQYRNDLGARVSNAELQLDVTLGTFLDADDEVLGSTTTLITDANGDASVRWRAGTVPGDAVVSVACRGACRAEATIDLVPVTPDAVTGLEVTGGNERLVVAFELPDDVAVRDVEYLVWPVSGAPSTDWTSSGATMSPLTITGLTNGVTYAVQLRAIADAPNAAPGAASEVAEGTPTWPEVGIDLTTDVSFLPADGADGDVTARLTLQDGGPAVNVPLDVTATAPVLLDGGVVTDAISVVSGEDGSVTFGLRALTEPGVVTVTITCPGTDCSSSFTIEFHSTRADAPTNLLAIAGNRKIWLVFDEPTGDVIGYQYRIDDGAWIDVPEGATQPYLILEVPNGVEVDVMARAVTSDGSTAPSNVVSVTPNPVGEPEADVGVDTPDVPLDVPLVSGVALLTVPFVFVNEGDAELTSVWLSEVGLREGERLIAISSDVGVITQYGARWFWRDFVLAPGGSIPGTLTIEIEERP